jgi:hypothetical protein
MRRYTPLKVLLALVVTISAQQVAYVAVGERPSAAADMLTAFCIGLGFILWVVEDARLRRCVPCYDFGFLITVFYPVSVFWYVFWSRGWRGFFTLAGMFVLIFLPWVSAIVAWTLIYNPA